MIYHNGFVSTYYVDNSELTGGDASEVSVSNVSKQGKEVYSILQNLLYTHEIEFLLMILLLFVCSKWNSPRH